MTMRALVLAAGEGTRLRPLTLTCPKPMLPIGGVPLLLFGVKLLRYYGIGEIAINLHHCPEVIPSYFGDGSQFGVQVVYSREEPIAGTAGAAKVLAWYFPSTFVVFYGDVLTNLDLGALVRYHRQRGAMATLALYRVSDPQNRGMVRVDAGGRILEFREKPAPEENLGNLASAGLYVVEPHILSFIPEGTFFDFGRDLFPQLLAQGLPLYGLETSAYVLDIGNLENYRRAQDDYAAGRIIWPWAEGEALAASQGPRGATREGGAAC